ncbi:mechanosensitive ion channel family protein [Halorussus litoreus]|uniref:mechanosensitive ion channel family protein n=1 Tax=Halorussus litoreus TaxID=1710536 RepID=UPI000E22F835|nr:mechanosensitive ion channel family protein [Halorussus litoreus]
MIGEILAVLASIVDRLAGFTETDLRLAVTAFVVLLGAGSVVVARRVRLRLRERFHDNVADVAYTATVGLVLTAGVLALLVLWGVGDDVSQVLAEFSGPISKGVTVALALSVLGIAYVANGVVKRAIDRFADDHDTITEHQSEIVYRVCQLTVYVAAVAVILGMWDVDLSGLLVGAGFLGIVVGMAARQTLGSLLAGFVLMFSRPFEIGDWVQIDDEEGIVTDISIVNTRIQTFDGEYVMIPNDIVSGRKIVNKSRKGRLRLEIEVGVDYESDVERAAEVAKAATKDLDEIMKVPTPKVVLKEFGDSAVTLGLRVWIDKPSARRQWRARTAVIGSVKAAFDSEGIKIPFPQRELTGREESGGFHLTEESAAPAPTGDGPRSKSEGVGEGGSDGISEEVVEE